MRRLIWYALALGSPAALRAQDAQPIVIRAARMLDVSSGRMLTSAAVVVQGDRISRRIVVLP